MLLSFEQKETYTNIIDKCQQSLQLWETLLNLTGAVELKKCFITVLQYSTSYKWHNSRPGEPQLVQDRKEQRQCVITRDGEKGTVIRQQNTAEGV